jgi:hypothetical protein
MALLLVDAISIVQPTSTGTFERVERSESGSVGPPSTHNGDSLLTLVVLLCLKDNDHVLIIPLSHLPFVFHDKGWLSMPAQLKGREIAQNLELSASSIMTSFTHYRALLAPLAVGALTVDELSTGYSQLAGVLDALLGRDLPGHPLDCFWFTNLRDQCLRYALSLREPQPAAYLHARKHHLRGLKQTLRHQFVRLHGGWKLGTLLKDVRSLAQARQCRGYGALAQLRDYGACLDSLEPLLRCQCFAAASFNAADRFGHPLDLLRLTQALCPGPVSNPTSGQTLIFGFARPSDEEAEALLHDLETVCCLLQLNCLAVEHQLCTYTVVLEQPGSPRRALRNGDFTALAQHTRDSLNLLAWYDEQVSRSAEAHWVG